MDCLVWEGLGNRFNCIASCLTATEQAVKLYWSVNEHCPLRYEELFRPHPRVNVRNIYARRFEYSSSKHRICYYYCVNPSKLPSKEFGRKINSNYRDLFNLLKFGSGNLELRGVKSIGINYRKYLEGNIDIEEFLRFCEIKIREVGPEKVFISSDCIQSSTYLASKIPNSVMQSDRGMSSDLGRDTTNFTSWIDTLKSYRMCDQGIVSSYKRSTVPDCLRGFGIKSIFPKCEEDWRDSNIENQINQAMPAFIEEME